MLAFRSRLIRIETADNTTSELSCLRQAEWINLQRIRPCKLLNQVAIKLLDSHPTLPVLG